MSVTDLAEGSQLMNYRALLCLVLLLPVGASAWWSPDWTQRKTIVVNTGGTGANTQQPLNDVPVLVRLHGGNFPQFLNVRDGAADFRFIAADDTTPLKYHVEQFDPVSQIALVWVKLPILNPQSTEQKFFLYFGNQAAVQGGDPGATYDVGTAAVYHFGDTAGVPRDSTAYASPVSSAEVISNPASIIGRGALLSGTAPLVIADAPQLGLNQEQGQTYGLWMKLEALPESQVTLFHREDGSARFAVTLDGGTLVARYGDTEVTAFEPLAAGAWQHVAVVLGNGELQLYLNGAKVGGAAATIAAMTGPVYVGGDPAGGGLLNAAIDEVRIDAVARSADRIAFDHAVQGERNNAVMTYAADESADTEGAGDPTGHTSHFGIIIQNVFGNSEAIVEQLVIGLCGVMMAIAVLVMFVKAIALSRSRRATTRFLNAYAAMGADGDDSLDGLVDGEETFGDSPLFSVYAQAIREVRARLSPAVGAQVAGLERKSLEAIRATLDAVMVREGQKLNGMLVLLTMAISGGPFIGLLGTVVGVMVTFAAIAATGDVNIAAIAPGMAAALLATVAGLGVAIPSLFGYNYLSAKAKEINADMHVFADEFVARMNERYGI